MSSTDQRKVFSWKRPVPSDRRPAIRLTASGRKWDVRLIGQVSRTRFLVTHPVDDGMLVFVKEGADRDEAKRLVCVSRFTVAVLG